MLSLGQFGIHEGFDLESPLPLVKLSIILKERGEILLTALSCLPCQPLTDFGESYGHVLIGGQSGSTCSSGLSPRKKNKLIGVEFHDTHESLAERREESKRAASAEDWLNDVSTMGESRHGLHGNGVENRRGNVACGETSAYKVLDICLSEDATARGDGIDARESSSGIAHLLWLNVHKRRHLVNECASSTCARAVHADVRALILMEEYHLGVLTT